MGFFSSKSKTAEKKKKQQQQQSRWNITDPPNVYHTKQQQQQQQQSASSALPYRPGQSQGQGPYGGNIQASYTQPNLSRWTTALPPSAPPPPPAKQQQTRLGRWTGSMLNLADMAPPLTQAYDEICNRFDDVMTRIDSEAMCGFESNLFSYKEPADIYEQTTSTSNDRSLTTLSNIAPKSNRNKTKTKTKTPSQATQITSGTYFAKVELYANSKLPASLPPLTLYMPTWPLLSLAAQYSQRVYARPTGKEHNSSVYYTSGNWRSGTKATYLKSVPMDDAHTIVFAIRGTSSFMDWAVNLNSEPTSPSGFLDDAGNLCHAGFLGVARKMVVPVAARLRQLLEEDPGRAAYSLLITGHSAGGAVAALLYMHMVSVVAGSELSDLAGCFKRIHCVTFGAPPVSLLPLKKPDVKRLRKSLFLSFVNEGDPVVRADKAYVKSLLELLATPPPEQEFVGDTSQAAATNRRQQRGRMERYDPNPPPTPPRKHKPQTWPVPTCTLSNAGRIVVLRSGDPMAVPQERKTVRQRLDEGVVAATCKEEMLRGVIWGDPVCHLMSFYAARIEVLAVAAVTAR